YYGGIWTHVQIIKLIDHDAPQFGDCTDQHVDGVESTCAGRLIHDPQIYDHCTPLEDLEYEYKVDIYANGSHDIVREGYSIIDEVLPVGTHKVLWFVDDGCGNLGTCSYYVTVVDAKPPTPVCYAELSTVVMPQGGMITLWARDYDASSFDNCTAPQNLKFSFTPNYNQGSRTFTCDDVGTNMLQVYVTDASGNQAFCNVYLQLDDNEAVCESMNVISGEVETFSGTPVAEAAVALYKVMPNQVMEMDLERATDTEGAYQVGFGTTQYDRMIHATKTGDPLEGISTLDMVFMQQHIMGIAPITQPEALYAADLDGSGHVGVNDLLMLRDAFLSNGKSLHGAPLPWLIYPEACTWTDGQLDPECGIMVEVDHTAPPAEAVNFKAVKKGDVNGDVLTQLNNRSNGLQLGVLAKATYRGSELQLIALDQAVMTGMQLSLASSLFDEETVVVQSGKLSVGDQNYFADAEFGTLNVAWVGTGGLQISEGDVLLTIELAHDALQPVADAIRFRGVYPDQYYTSDRQPMPVNLRWLNVPEVSVDQTVLSAATGITEDAGTGKAGQQVAGIVAGLVVQPNPMTVSSVVRFESSQEVQGQLSVFGADSREVMAVPLNITRGVNDVVIRADQLSGAGVYYFRIQAGDQTQTGKFVVIDR
ncbi:MAG: T9SS type A sorting domain-containing protein, partial [Saprospiraceae bacterium]|nr:T9SS type A sorting domain-containing protein [Saprospiraceae bacterium]